MRKYSSKIQDKFTYPAFPGVASNEGKAAELLDPENLQVSLS